MSLNKLIDLIIRNSNLEKIAMDPVTNPYVLGAGSQPPEFAGRDEALERTRITLARIKNGRRGAILRALTNSAQTNLAKMSPATTCAG